MLEVKVLSIFERGEGLSQEMGGVIIELSTYVLGTFLYVSIANFC